MNTGGKKRGFTVDGFSRAKKSSPDVRIRSSQRSSSHTATAILPSGQRRRKKSIFHPKVVDLTPNTEDVDVYREDIIEEVANDYIPEQKAAEQRSAAARIQKIHPVMMDPIDPIPVDVYKLVPDDEQDLEDHASYSIDEPADSTGHHEAKHIDLEAIGYKRSRPRDIRLNITDDSEVLKEIPVRINKRLQPQLAPVSKKLREAINFLDDGPKIFYPPAQEAAPEAEITAEQTVGEYLYESEKVQSPAQVQIQQSEKTNTEDTSATPDVTQTMDSEEKQEFLELKITDERKIDPTTGLPALQKPGDRIKAEVIEQMIEEHIPVKVDEDFYYKKELDEKKKRQDSRFEKLRQKVYSKKQTVRKPQAGPAKVSHKQKAAARRQKLAARIFLAVIGIGLAILVAFFAANYIKQQQQAQTLSVFKDAETVNSITQTGQDSDNSALWKKTLRELYEKNSDIVGVLYVPGTNINYPVVHTPNDAEGDNTYLRQNLDHQYDERGTIFVDKYNDMADQSLIIYGHNMQDGTMFTDVEKYRDENFLNENHEVHLYLISKTDDGYTYEHRKYQIFTVIKDKVHLKSENIFKYYKYYGSEDMNGVRQYLNDLENISLYKSSFLEDIKTKAESGDAELDAFDFITLSCCEYSQDNGRIALVAAEEK